MVPVTLPVREGPGVGSVVSYSEHKRRMRGGRARLADPALSEILEALNALGGSAHRQAVADQIALRRSGRSCPADTATRSEIYFAFDAYLTWAATRKPPPLLWRPLGAGSYRWALTDTGMRLFQSPPAAARLLR